MEEKHLSSAGNYTDDSIRTMEGMKHIRLRPGMYIGGLGNGTDPRHGIYTILKEVIDNSVDEFTMGFGKNIIVDVDEKTASVRDYGQGIPLGSVIKASRRVILLQDPRRISSGRRSCIGIRPRWRQIDAVPLRPGRDHR